MADIVCALVGLRFGIKVFIYLGPHTAVVAINESRAYEAPNSAIPVVVGVVSVDGVQKSGRADPFAARPPIAVAYARPALPIQSVVEPARVLVPSVVHRSSEKRLRTDRKPLQRSAAEFPHLNQ